jgi:hypothetical protein
MPDPCCLLPDHRTDFKGRRAAAATASRAAAAAAASRARRRRRQPPPPPAAPPPPPPSQTKNAATPRERRPGEQKQLTMFEALPSATRMYVSSAAAAQARRAADAPRTQEEMEAQAGLEVVKFPSEKGVEQPKPQYSCPNCPKVFEAPGALAMHVTWKHPSAPTLSFSSMIKEPPRVGAKLTMKEDAARSPASTRSTSSTQVGC